MFCVFQQSCVVMQMAPGSEGRWADTACSQPLGFICQTRQSESQIHTVEYLELL